jgi:hypothetical protein
VPIAIEVISSTGIAIGMLEINPSTMPCNHQDIRSALIPIINPIIVRPRTMRYIVEVVIGSTEFGLLLAMAIHTSPKINPQAVAEIIRFALSILEPSLLI